MSTDDLVKRLYRLPPPDTDRSIPQEAAARIEALESNLAAAREDAERLLRFAGECLEPWPECLYDLEGDMQERLHKAGLTEKRAATEEGDDHDIGDEVYYLSDLGHRAIAAHKGTT